VKEPLFKNKYSCDILSSTPLILMSNFTLSQDLLADPTELDRSNLSDEHFPIIFGADTITVGTTGCVAEEIKIFRETRD
jgi:hypothetical protein